MLDSWFRSPDLISGCGERPLIVFHVAWADDHSWQFVAKIEAGQAYQPTAACPISEELNALGNIA